ARPRGAARRSRWPTPQAPSRLSAARRQPAAPPPRPPKATPTAATSCSRSPATRCRAAAPGRTRCPSPPSRGGYASSTAGSASRRCRPQEGVQPRGHGLPSLAQEGFVGRNVAQRRRRRDALGLERARPGLLEHRWEVHGRLLVADLAVRLAADEGEVRDVVRLTRRVAALQDCLGKDVVELETVVTA